jgi:ribonuclease VapC
VVVDTSALVAIDLDEPDAAWFAHEISAADDAVMTTATLQELIVVLALRAHITDHVEFALSVARATVEQGIRLVSVDTRMALLGAVGVLKFRGSPARLNFGDGFTYALARQMNAPILCKGEDFLHSDVDVRQPPPVIV